MIRITPIYKPFNKAFWKGVQQPDVYGDNHLTMGQLTTETVRAWDDPALSSRALQLNLCSVFCEVRICGFLCSLFSGMEKGHKKKRVLILISRLLKESFGGFSQDFYLRIANRRSFLGNPQLCLCFLLALFFYFQDETCDGFAIPTVYVQHFHGTFHRKKQKKL